MVNLVGIQTEILDGNLRTQVTLPENTSLVIERASSGPSNSLYVVQDFKIAESIYGSQSPLIQLAKDVLAGSNGATSIALYRIGGGPASIKNIFGEFTEISTIAETITAGEDLSLYIGPRPNDASKACVIVYKAGKVVYSNVPNNIVRGLDVLVVDGFDPENQPYRVGSVTSPVLFSEVVNNLLDSTIQVVTATAGQTLITLGSPVPSTTANLAVSKTVGGVTTNFTTYTTTVTAGDLVSITLTTPAAANDVYTLNYTQPTDPQTVIDNEITYASGKNSLNADLKGLYEIYDSAFEDLENVRASTVTIKDLFNCRNIVAGDDASKDRLTYVQRTEVDEGFTYEWSVDKFLYQLATNSSLTTADPLLAATDGNGQPVVVKAYNEVDFAHRLGMWCWKNSTSSDYINGTIGAALPKSTTTVAVKRWIGTLPTYDIFGNIVANGTGLLGNRFMAGTIDKVQGFYATDSGYPDGSPLKDSYGSVVDLGKYLSIATIPMYLTTDLLSGRVAPLVAPRSFAGAYAGLITTIRPGDSTTNVAFNNISPLFTITDSVANKLSSLGYVALVQKPNKGVTVYSGDLATNGNSDFDYVSTAIAVSYIVRRINDAVDPFLGRGIDFPLAAALQNAVDLVIKSATSAGVINGGSVSIARTSPHQMQIRLTIQAKEELRQVVTTIALTPDTTFIQQ